MEVRNHYNYGSGDDNRDPVTKIRYGVIPPQDVYYWNDVAEPADTPPMCPDCGRDVVEYNEHNHERYERSNGLRCCPDFACENCRHAMSDMDVHYADDCVPMILDDGDYKAHETPGRDVWVVRSPFFTYAEFCSPCAPGALYLLNSVEPCEDMRAYCFGPDMFKDDKPPYDVYSVETGELIYKCDDEKD
jgi:hypothetical protein